MENVTVIGAGVIGLTTAMRLLELGCGVKVLARERTPRTTSDIAAAIWLPYKVEQSERVAAWAIESRRWYEELARRDVPGVRIIPMEVQVGREPSAEWDDFARRYQAVQTPGLLRLDVPQIESPVFMGWLERQVSGRGGSIMQREVNDLAELAGEAQVVVNCSGLGAGKIARDAAVFPIQGQIVRVARDPSLGDTILLDESGAEPMYIVPRTNDCVLGGTAVDHARSTQPDPAVTRSILARCGAAHPGVLRAAVLAERVGLRPGRKTIRLEAEALASGARVIHNYGHGGAGFTTAWGTAGAAAKLVG